MYPVTEFSQNIAVIGAAINGLVAANYLQRTGHQVSLLERSDRQGLADHCCRDQINDIACFAARSPSSQAVVHSWNPDSSEWPKRTLP